VSTTAPFDGLPEQPEARRLLTAAIGKPAHAYLLSGPAGTGKRRFAERFAAALLLSRPGRITARTHPDLFVLEAQGSSILVDQARELRRDLHMRPFEGERRVYLVLDAHLLRAESANALLKSLEEPPQYAVFILVSDHAERMLPTIRSRMQTVPFRRLSTADLEALTGDPVAARAALGNLERAERLARDPAAAARRRAYLALARASRIDPEFDGAAAAKEIAAAATERAKEAQRRVEQEGATQLESMDEGRDRRAVQKRIEERAKRASRRAEVEEVRDAVDAVALWYRDLLATGLGAENAVVHSDLAGELAEDAQSGPPGDAARAVAVVSDVRRSLELNVQPALAVEAMFHRLRQVTAGR
jgi:DNA polymerase-3 subunit delta'